MDHRDFQKTLASLDGFEEVARLAMHAELSIGDMLRVCTPAMFPEALSLLGGDWYAAFDSTVSRLTDNAQRVITDCKMLIEHEVDLTFVSPFLLGAVQVQGILDLFGPDQRGYMLQWLCILVDGFRGELIAELERMGKL